MVIKNKPVEAPAESVVVSATGSASSGQQLGLSKVYEKAMSDSIVAASKECEDIWASDLSLEEKNAKIAAIQDPDALRARQLAARQKIKDVVTTVIADTEKRSAEKSSAEAEKE